MGHPGNPYHDKIGRFSGGPNGGDKGVAKGHNAGSGNRAVARHINAEFVVKNTYHDQKKGYGVSLDPKDGPQIEKLFVVHHARSGSEVASFKNKQSAQRSIRSGSIAKLHKVDKKYASPSYKAGLKGKM